MNAEMHLPEWRRLELRIDTDFDSVCDMERVLRQVLLSVVVSLRVLVTAGFLVALLLNFANVAMRYGFQSPIYWAEEVIIFIFAWCTFMGAALVTMSGRHLRVDLINNLLSPKGVRILDAFVYFVSAAVMLFVAWRAWTIVSLVWRVDQRSIVADVPMYLPYMAVFLGSLLIAIACILRPIIGQFPPNEPVT